MSNYQHAVLAGLNSAICWSAAGVVTDEGVRLILTLVAIASHLTMVWAMWKSGREE